VKPVVESWDPRRAALSASFHPHFSKEEEFLGKLGALRAAGFEVMASVVAYPEYFDRLPSLMKRFEAAGHPLYLNPFQGDYQGRTYPQGYEAAQSAFLHANAAASELEYRMREASPLGRSCAAGQKYFRAWPDGSLHRCCPARELGEAPLGHIRDENFALADAPAPCPAQKCFAPNEIVHLLPADSQLREESSVTSR
jgi:hypothetical protein